MDARTFESALGAAARVAFSVSLVSACGTRAESEPASGYQSDTDDQSSELSRARASKSDAGPPITPCCERGIKNVYVETDAGMVVDPARVTPEVLACCTVVLDKAEAGDFSIDWTLVSACCFDAVSGPRSWPHPTHPRACTPWGPPVPPAMPRLEAMS